MNTQNIIGMVVLLAIVVAGTLFAGWLKVKIAA